MTNNLYVLGHPVSHSKSPAMHNAAYRALGLDWSYGLADCATDEAALHFLREGEWMALNITMPYKPLALKLATGPSDAAVLAQGANVLVRRGDELLADNTDGKGCVAYLSRCGVRFSGSRVVVCGTGPTSLALMHAAVGAGAGCVTLLGRDEGRACQVLEGYRARLAQLPQPLHGHGAQAASQANHAPEVASQANRAPEAASQANRAPEAASRAPEAAAGAASGALAAGSYASAAQVISSADVILDATPLGMKAGDSAPFDTALLGEGQVVFDVVYGHGVTPLIAGARAAGCEAFDGFGMLVAQAVETVVDIVTWLDVPIDLASVDLFDVMASQ